MCVRKKERERERERKREREKERMRVCMRERKVSELKHQQPHTLIFAIITERGRSAFRRIHIGISQNGLANPTECLK